MPVLLARRQDCYFDGAQEYCESNAWDDWVRWVVLVCVVVGFFLLFVFCSCLTARRRRRAGRQPIYGTGWAVRNGHGEAQYIGPQNPHPVAPAANADPNWHAQSYANNPHAAPNAQPYFNDQQGTWSQPPPTYSPPAAGYYAGQQYGYEMQNQPQQPPNTYQPQHSAAGSGYAPPEGPPPPKEGSAVR